MRVLLDENTAEALITALPEFEVWHVHAMGWKGLWNGDLLAAAEKEGFDILVTVDKSMEYQESFKGRRLGLLGTPEILHRNLL